MCNIYCQTINAENVVVAKKLIRKPIYSDL